MLAILNVTAPFFALVLCGYLAARARVLPEQAVPALNTFVLYFALPCMLFRFTAATPFSQILNLPVFLAYMTTGLSVLLLLAAILRFAGKESLKDAAFAGLAAAWSNWGYMGLPLFPALLGSRALAAMIAAGMADLTVIISAGLALASLDNRSGGGVLMALRGALRHIAKNPLIWAVLLGGVFSAGALQLPAPADEFIRLLGQAAGPVALFTIGVSLYRPGVRVVRPDVITITGFKLLLHPLLAGICAVYLFGLTALETHTIVLGAALPAGGSTFLFAERQGADADRIAAVILVSTALAFITFSALCWLLGVQLPH
jgi:malonate transporter and related proteins